MTSSDASGDGGYPRTWFLMDMVENRPRLLGTEVVDLSPAAIELREAARELKGWADDRDRWLEVDGRGRWERLEGGYRRSLSFGPEVAYCVERDGRRRIHDGKPLRHLVVRTPEGSLTPATPAEIALYFYGRRPAALGFAAPGRVHGFVGYDWGELSREDVRWLLEREREGDPDE